MNRVSGHWHFIKGVYFYIAAFGENTFWAHVCLFFCCSASSGHWEKLSRCHNTQSGIQFLSYINGLDSHAHCLSDHTSLCYIPAHTKLHVSCLYLLSRLPNLLRRKSGQTWIFRRLADAIRLDCKERRKKKIPHGARCVVISNKCSCQTARRCSLKKAIALKA